MATKDVELVIRARNEAEKAIKSVEDALVRLKKAQDTAATSAAATGSAADKLKGNLATLADQDQVIKALATVATQIERAERSADRASAALPKLREEEARLAEDAKKAAQAHADLQSRVAAADAALKNAGTKVPREALKELTKELGAAQRAYEKLEKKRGSIPVNDTAAVSAWAQAHRSATKTLDEVRAKVDVAKSNFEALAEAEKKAAAALKQLRADEAAAATSARTSSVRARVGERAREVGETRAEKTAAALEEIRAAAAPAAAAIGVATVKQEELGQASARTTALIQQTTRAIEAEAVAAKKAAAPVATPADGRRRLADYKEEQTAIGSAKVSLDDARARMQATREEATRLGREIARAGTSTADIASQFDLARLESNKARDAYFEQARAVRVLVDAENARKANAARQPQFEVSGVGTSTREAMAQLATTAAENRALEEEARAARDAARAAMRERVAVPVVPVDERKPSRRKAAEPTEQETKRTLAGYKAEQESIQNAKGALVASKQAMEAAREEATRLGREIATATRPTSEMVDKFNAARLASKGTEQAYIAQAAAVRRLVEAERTRIATATRAVELAKQQKQAAALEQVGAPTRQAMAELQGRSLGQIGAQTRQAMGELNKLETFAEGVGESTRASLGRVQDHAASAIGEQTRQAMTALDQLNKVGAATRQAMSRAMAVAREQTEEEKGVRAAWKAFDRDAANEKLKTFSNRANPFPEGMRKLGGPALPLVDPMAMGMSHAGRAASDAANVLSESTKRVRSEHVQAAGAVGDLTSRLAALASMYIGVHTAISQLHAVVEVIRTLDAAQTRLAVVFDGSTSKIMSDMTFLKAEASRLGISFGVLSSQYGQFAIAAKEAGAGGDEIRKIFTSFAEAGRVAKLSEAEMRRVFLALDQMMSKGKIQAEEITRQLAQVIPGAPRIFARALGMNSGEFQDALKEGAVPASIENLLKVAAEIDKTYGSQVPAALKTTTTELDRFQNTVFRLREAFAEGGFSVGLRDFVKALNEVGDNSKARSFFSELGVSVTLAMRGVQLLGTGLSYVAKGGDWLGQNVLGPVMAKFDGFKALADFIQRQKQEIRDASDAPPQIAQHREAMEALQKAYEANGRSVEGLREKVGVSAEQASRSFEEMFQVFQKHAVEFNRTQLVPFEKGMPSAGFDDAERGKLSSLLADIREGKITVQQFGKSLREMSENASTDKAHAALLKLLGVLPDLQKHETDFANAAALAADKNESARKTAEKYGVTISSILDPQEKDAAAKRAEEAAAESVKNAFKGLNEVINASTAGHSALSKASDAVRAALEAEGSAADDATKKLLRARAEQAALAAARKEVGLKVDEESLDQNVPTEVQLRARQIRDNARAQAKREKEQSDAAEQAKKDADKKKADQKRFDRQFDVELDKRQFRGEQKGEVDQAKANLKAAQKSGVGVDEAQAALNEVEKRQFIEKAIEDEREKAQSRGAQLDGDREEKIRAVAEAEYDASHALDSQEQKKQRLIDAEQRLGDLVARRKAIEESIQWNKDHPGETGAATTPELQSELQGVTEEARKAADEAERLAKSLGDQKSLDNLRNTRNALIETKSGFLDLNAVSTTFANGLTDAFGKAAESLGAAIGRTKKWSDAWKEVRNTFLNFAADFLKQIGQMLIRKALFNALGLEEGKGGGGGGGGGSTGGGLMGALTPFFKSGSGGSESGLFSTGSGTATGGGVLGGLTSLLGGGSGKGSSAGAGEAGKAVQEVVTTARDTVGKAVVEKGVVKGVEEAADRSPLKTLMRGAHGQSLTKVFTSDGKSALVNADHAPKFQKMISDLEKSGYKINDVQGYADRNIRGSNRLSNHALGNAIDINPTHNPMGPRLVTDLPSNVSEMAKLNGLTWGGDWKTRKDAMHFEVPRNAKVIPLRDRTFTDYAGSDPKEFERAREETDKRPLEDPKKPTLHVDDIDTTPIGSIPKDTLPPVDPKVGGTGDLSGLLGSLTSLTSLTSRANGKAPSKGSQLMQAAPSLLMKLLPLLFGGGGGGGMFASIFHAGGGVGSGGAVRLVDPSVFIHAARMHSGASVGTGLGPHEVPAVLEKGEKVLSKSQARQAPGKGSAPGKDRGVKIVNAFHAGEFVSHGLDTPEGEDAIFNFVRVNKSAIKGIIG